MSLALIAGPQVKPISLAEAKAHLRVTNTADDALIDELIAAATDRGEVITGRSFLRTTWEQRHDQAPCETSIALARPPLIDVVSVKYYDTAGVQQTWDPSNYQIDAPAGPTAGRGRLQPAYGVSWPSTRSDTLNAFIVQFRGGYGTSPVSVPRAIRQALLLMIGRWYYDREDFALQAAPLASLALLTPFKVF